MPKPNIIAKNIEEFKKIDGLLLKLPESIRNQIVTASTGLVGLKCIIRNHIGVTNQKIYLPNNVTQINHFEGYVGIYCDEYFFEITGDNGLLNKDLIFINISEE